MTTKRKEIIGELYMDQVYSEDWDGLVSYYWQPSIKTIDNFYESICHWLKEFECKRVKLIIEEI